MANDYPNYRVALAIFAIIALGGFFYYHNALAVTLTPIRFEVAGNPGDVLDEELTVINETKDVETYYSSYANFESQGESGTPSFVTPKDDLGTWISTGVSSVTLNPGQQKLIPFKITIPRNAEPGGHFAVIFWGTSPAGQGQIGVGAKTGVLVLLSVSGDVKEEAGLLNFNTVGKQFLYKTLPVSFEYRFKNDGGDRVKPQGTITLRDTVFFPADVIDANPSEGNVLPNSTRRITADWVKYERPKEYVAPSGFFAKFWSEAGYEWKNFAVGLYSANLHVAYGTKGEQVKKTVFFFVFPWELLIVIIIALIIILWGGKFAIKRYNRFIIEKARAGLQ